MCGVYVSLTICTIIIGILFAILFGGPDINKPVKSKLGIDAARQLVEMVRRKGVASPNDIKVIEHKMREFRFNHFSTSSATNKYEIPKKDVELFLWNYLSTEGYEGPDIQQTISAIKYATRGTQEIGISRLESQARGEIKVSFIAFTVIGDYVYFIFAGSAAKYELASEEGGWGEWITGNNNQGLSSTDVSNLNSILFFHATKSFVGSLDAENRGKVPQEDKKLLELT